MASEKFEIYLKKKKSPRAQIFCYFCYKSRNKKTRIEKLDYINQYSQQIQQIGKMNQRKYDCLYRGEALNVPIAF